MVSHRAAQDATTWQRLDLATSEGQAGAAVGSGQALRRSLRLGFSHLLRLVDGGHLWRCRFDCAVQGGGCLQIALDLMASLDVKADGWVASLTLGGRRIAQGR